MSASQKRVGREQAFDWCILRESNHQEKGEKGKDRPLYLTAMKMTQEMVKMENDLKRQSLKQWREVEFTPV